MQPSYTKERVDRLNSEHSSPANDPVVRSVRIVEASDEELLFLATGEIGPLDG